jgi:hypothetical protein
MNIDFCPHGSSLTFNREHRQELIEGYGTWIKQKVRAGWTPYLFTFMFNPLASTKEAKVAQMHEEITTVYRKLATRVVRKPRSLIQSQLLPMGVFFLDAPVYKRQNSAFEMLLLMTACICMVSLSRPRHRA